MHPKFQSVPSLSCPTQDLTHYWGTNPAPRTQSHGHPETISLANVDSDRRHEELEPIVVITTEKNIFDPVASPFVPAAREEQPLQDPTLEDVPIPLNEISLGAVEMPAAGDPGSDPPEEVQPPRMEDADLTDVAECVGPGGVATRSGHVIHPPDHLICTGPLICTYLYIII